MAVWRIRLMRFIKSRSLVDWLVTLWIVLIVYGESWTYTSHVRSCSQTVRRIAKPHGYIIQLVADPQLTDEYSYKISSSFVLNLIKYYSDVYMQRSYRASMSQLKPDLVVFLGDLMDGGREWVGEEYEAYFWRDLRRFKRIFHTPRHVPVYYMAGNHDIGFGDTLVEEAYARHVQIFGNTSDIVRLQSGTAQIELVILDTISLSYGQSLMAQQQAHAVYHEIKSRRQSSNEQQAQSAIQRFLFTHVPLHRPAGSSCGELRHNAKSIYQHRGYQYQNLIPESASKEILQTVQPLVTFSGDDHDQCYHVHQVGDSQYPEYTIGTFSWLQGNRYPSFGILYVDDANYSVQICQLPQMIYIFKLYILASIVSIIAILINAYSHQTRLWHQKAHGSRDLESSRYSPSIQSPQFIYRMMTAYFVPQLLRLLVYGLSFYSLMQVYKYYN
ncbi:hypothetical protein MP228_012362 [Amoeboaphelidium protococcarum]|nr:hypothetical protein MP228_012362 [Amoeboaphelidium protococcarum]